MEQITPLISLIFGAGGLGTFAGAYIIFYKSKKRKANAEASDAELTNIDKILNQKETILEDYKEQITYLKEEKETYRQEANAARKLIGDLYLQLSIKDDQLLKLTSENARLLYHKCTVSGCKRRQPPRKELLDITENEEL